MNPSHHLTDLWYAGFETLSSMITAWFSQQLDHKYSFTWQVDISDVSDEYTVWAITSDRDPTEPVTDQGQDGMDEEAAGKVGAVDIPNAICCVPDPRVPLFGQRVLFHRGDGVFCCIMVTFSCTHYGHTVLCLHVVRNVFCTICCLSSLIVKREGEREGT